MKKQGGKRPGSGRKKCTPTTLLNLRVPVQLKEDLKMRYGKKLNGIIKEYLNKIAYYEYF